MNITQTSFNKLDNTTYRLFVKTETNTYSLDVNGSSDPSEEVIQNIFNQHKNKFIIEAEIINNV